MTRRQLNIYEVITKTNHGALTVAEAAEALKLSTRQIKRLKKKVREGGAAALIHANSLKTPAHAMRNETKDNILTLRKEEPYCRSNFKHFKELLDEHHDIKVSYSALYKLLKEAGITSPKVRRPPTAHRRRKRKPQAGLLLQIDATPFAWFSGDKRSYALHGAIDDATGQVTGLYMTKNECLQGYFEMLQRTIDNYGIPVSIYADRHTIFQSPNKAKAEIDPKIPVNDTQFGRSLKELGITLIAARSPQAKGRIERLWETLQSRLPVDLALFDICTIEEANEFLKTYIYDFNSKFAEEPADSESMFCPVTENCRLDYILCVKEKRTVDSGGVFSFGGRSFKIVETISTGIVPRGAKINVLASSSFGIKAEYRKLVFDVLPFVPSRKVKKPKPQASTARTIPDSSYWKYGQHLFPKLMYEESDSEIVAMLENIFLSKVI